MFDELNKYKEADHFFLRSNGEINTLCNAPAKNGVFLIYSLNRGRIELVYIGCSDVTLEPQGLKDQIISMGKFLITKIMKEGADALDIYWYVTTAGRKADSPKEIEFKILKRQIEISGSVPRWNK